MKRKELIKKIEEMGCILIKHGGRHNWYQNPKTEIFQPVPKCDEINEYLVNHIIKILEKES